MSIEVAIGTRRITIIDEIVSDGEIEVDAYDEFLDNATHEIARQWDVVYGGIPLTSKELYQLNDHLVEFFQSRRDFGD